MTASPAGGAGAAAAAVSSTVRTLIYGPVAHSLGPSQLRVAPSALLAVNAAGKVDFLLEGVDEQRCAALREVYAEAEFCRLGKRQFLLPGFVDTHTHAPQFTFAGTGQDLPLLDWLNRYAFPREAAFACADHARRVYGAVVSRLVSCGTTAACYFGTVHLEGTVALVDAVVERGQRALVGKVCMDRKAPDYYVERTDESLRGAREFARRVRERAAAGGAGLVEAAVTPRFVPACSRELLRGLGRLARELDLPVQSHVSESRAECDWVRELHPDPGGGGGGGGSYAAVYDDAGLLTPRTVMAHAVHLSAEERALFRSRGVGIAHCPNSNFTLASGVLNVRRLLEEGHRKVGLGTDVSGGYHPSMLDAVRSAATAAKVVQMTERRKEGGGGAAAYAALTLAELVYLATLGGARVLGLPVGNFEPGMEFDALLVDLAAPAGPVDTFPEEDTLEEMLEKFLFLGDDRNIRRVWVRGNVVKDSAGDVRLSAAAAAGPVVR